MNVSEKLTQKQLLEIIINSCEKGRESKTIKVNEFIDEIRQQIINYSTEVKSIEEIV